MTEVSTPDTASTPTSSPMSEPIPTPISLTRIIRAELMRSWAVRSYRILLLVGMAAVVLMGVIMAFEGRGSAPDPQSVALPLEYAAYLVMILGILMVTGDLGSGTAVVAACQVPARSRLATAKYVAALAASVAIMVTLAVLMFVGVLLAGGTSAGDLTTSEFGDLWLSGVGAGVVAALLGVALGELLRVTALAMTLALLWSFVIETVLVFVIPEHLAAYLPFKTIGGSRLLLDELSAYAGLALFAGYALVALVLATLARPRRDLFSA